MYKEYLGKEEGQHFGALVLESNVWVHRRVERVVIEPTGECRRHISIDFTLPSEFAVPVHNERVLVPLGLMRKGPLASFSVTGPDGQAVPVLETSANARVSKSLISALARNVTANTVVDWVRFEELVSDIVLGEPGQTGNSIAELASIVRGAGDDRIARESLIQLVKQFAGFFLLVVELDAAVIDRRTIVKYTYREARNEGELRPLRPLFEFELPEFGAAASTHFELSPPPLMVVVDAYISAATSADSSTQTAEVQPTVFASLSAPAATCHLVAKPNDRAAHAIVRVWLAPRPYGAMSAAWIGALGVFVTLALILAVRLARAQGILPLVPAGSGTAAALVAGAGLLMTWIARAPEDWTTSQILANARRSLMASAMLAAGVAVFLGVPVWEPARSVTWLVLLAFAAVNLVIAVCQRLHCRYGTIPLRQPGGGRDGYEV